MSSTHSVRLLAGRCKRSLIPVLNEPGLRPTASRVRETLFNWLGIDLSHWRCLDAFAGTGALGFEAASRGAHEVILLDTNHEVVRCLQATLGRLQLTQAKALKENALHYFRYAPKASFEIVFLDPPFQETQLREESVQVALRLLVPGGFVYLESPVPVEPEQLPTGLELYRRARAGAVYFHLLKASA